MTRDSDQMLHTPATEAIRPSWSAEPKTRTHQRDVARRVVAGQATDAADCRRLLAMVGLLEEDTP